MDKSFLTGSAECSSSTPGDGSGAAKTGKKAAAGPAGTYHSRGAQDHIVRTEPPPCQGGKKKGSGWEKCCFVPFDAPKRFMISDTSLSFYYEAARQ